MRANLVVEMFFMVRFLWKLDACFFLVNKILNPEKIYKIATSKVHPYRLKTFVLEVIGFIIKAAINEVSNHFCSQTQHHCWLEN